MAVKLTLTVEKEVIEKAKIYAKEKGRSLSDIVESYLKSITSSSSRTSSEIAPITKSLKGSFKGKDIIQDYKKDLSDILNTKYSKDG